MAPLLAFSLTLLVGCCLLVLLVGGPFIRLLHARGIGKRIRVEGPSSHTEKMGTPTMGGVLICLTVLAVTLIVTLTIHRSTGRSVLLPAGVFAAVAALGAVDDLFDLFRRKGGMSVRSKFAGLTLVAVVAAVVLWHPGGLDINYVYLPRDPVPHVLPAGVFIPLAIFAIVGTSNAVNLTDGLDSLAATTAAWAFLAYGVIAFLQGQAFLVSFCFTVVGALLGFLWFNAHPAAVFMGDTGSLALGASLAVVALMTGHIVLLPLIGCVFVAEALSVLLQVGYFKVTRGKRLFRMAPLHHHFELLGWSETHVTQRFWLASKLAAFLGVALALI
jgi:phospho-N-acetylmuramoyl-pentapeptide-transferase